jgi:ABC-2 type transport system permease protein
MKTLLLVKAIVRGTTWFSADGIRELKRRNKSWIVPVALLGGLVGLSSYQVMIVAMYNGLATLGQATGRPELLLFYGVFAGWAFTFIGAVPLALSLMYYSKDTRMLLTLPLRPRQIIGSRVFLLYLYSLPVTLYLLLPALVIHALRYGASPLFFAAGFLNLFLIPLFPLSLALLLVLVLAKLVNLSRFRVAFEVAGMVIALGLVICLQVLLSRTMSSTFMGDTGAGIGALPDLYTSAARFFPPAAWAAEFFLPAKAAASGTCALLAAVGTFVVALLLAPLNFLRDVTERGESKRERKPTAGAMDFRGLARPRSMLRSLIRREFAVFTSNSTFIVQGTSELLIVPLLFLIYGLVLPKKVLGSALMFITSSPMIGPIILAVLCFMTNITSLSSTSISREGKGFSLSLVLPVPGREQVKAKLMVHLSLLLPAYLLNVALVMVFFRLPPAMLLFLVPAGPVFQVYSFCTCIYFDMKRPILSWTHPQQAIKNNLNSMIGPAGMMALMAALAVPSVPLLLSGFDPFLLCCLVLVVPLILDFLLLPRVFAYADRQYGGGLEFGG